MRVWEFEHPKLEKYKCPGVMGCLVGGGRGKGMVKF